MRKWLFPVDCVGCGRPGSALCAACVPRSSDAIDEHIDGIPLRSIAPYAGDWRAAIVALKSGDRALLEPLAAVLAAAVPSGSVLVPLPTTARRRDVRGFDQTIELVRRAARRAGATAMTSALLKRGGAQHGADRATRLSAGGRFVLVGALPPAVIVVDDVCTTGTTLRDGIATIAGAGTRIDGAIVLARALEPSGVVDGR